MKKAERAHPEPVKINFKLVQANVVPLLFALEFKVAGRSYNSSKLTALPGQGQVLPTNLHAGHSLLKTSQLNGSDAW